MARITQYLLLLPQKMIPKLQLPFYVENEGFGSTCAAPIASLMIEQYLNREVKRIWLEQYVLKGNTKREDG